MIDEEISYKFEVCKFYAKPLKLICWSSCLNCVIIMQLFFIASRAWIQSPLNPSGDLQSPKHQDAPSFSILSSLYCSLSLGSCLSPVWWPRCLSQSNQLHPHRRSLWNTSRGERERRKCGENPREQDSTELQQLWDFGSVSLPSAHSRPPHSN